MPENEEINYVSIIDFGDGIARHVRAAGEVDTISVNGVTQTISEHSVDLDVESNLITETMWTAISAKYD